MAGVANGSGVDVRASTVPAAGKGLFAGADGLVRGARVIEYTGRILTLQQAKVLKSRMYLKAVSLNRHIDGGPEELASAARFINDHVDASRHNVRFVTQDQRVFVVATRDVGADEELFVDYGRGHWLFCGSAAFLGLEVGADSRIPAPEVLKAARDLEEHEVVCCLASPAMEDADRLSSKVYFAQDATAHLANCRLKPSPFVSRTTVVTATRRLAAGDPVVVRAEDSLEVRPSRLPLAGMGAFARVPLLEGATLGRYYGKLLSAAERQARVDEFPRTADYIIGLRLGPGHGFGEVSAAETDVFVDPTDAKGQVRPYLTPTVCFINHDAAAPNCAFRQGSVAPGAADSVFVVATRDVKVDEELCTDYSGFFPGPL